MINIQFLILILIVIFIDQYTKYKVALYFKRARDIHIIRNIIYFKLVKNTGAALSMFKGKNRSLTIITSSIILVLSFFFIQLLKREGLLLFKTSVAMVLGGGIGNLIDRIRLGYVIDFFYFPFRKSPVFNIADLFIMVGMIIIIWLYLFDKIII